jgi:cell division protein FtsL
MRDESRGMSSSSEAFEYAIKKDVRNNPIVREVDERRLREQWRSVAIGVLFVGVLLFSGWQRVELLQHGYRVEQMQQERGDEEAINRHLRLEIETLKAPQRIERLAKGALHLVAPTAGSAIIIERVVPPDLPVPSIVARSEWAEGAPPFDPGSGRSERRRGTRSDAPSRGQGPPDRETVQEQSRERADLR